MASTSLTTHLLSLRPQALESATTHPFLRHAGSGTLPLPTLQKWLAQDRLYALHYITFISSLLSRVPIPTSRDRERSLEGRVVDLLIDSLTNVRREVGMFEDLAVEEGWEGRVWDVEEGEAVRKYRRLFEKAGKGEVGVGLVVLWGMEVAYLRAWKYAKTCGEGARAGEGGGGTGGGDVVRRVLIPNWTSQEFEGFVERIGKIVDAFGERWGRESEEWRVCERVFGEVVEVEGEFWPGVEG